MTEDEAINTISNLVIITPKLHTNNGFIQHRNGRKYKPIAVDGNKLLRQLDVASQSQRISELLENIDWKNDQAVMFGANNHQAKSSLAETRTSITATQYDKESLTLDSRFIRAQYWPNHNKRNLQFQLVKPIP
jgi:hypothetical protein